MLLASAAGGAGGAYLGAAGGGGLAALCAGLTGGACAVFAPYIVGGGTLLGRWAGAGLGGGLVDWIESSPPDDGITLESRKFGSESRQAADARARNPQTGKEECFFCGKEVDPNPGKPNSKQYDHWWPWSKGGQSTLSNSEVTCATCNGPGGKWYKLPWKW